MIDVDIVWNCNDKMYNKEKIYCENCFELSQSYADQLQDVIDQLNREIKRLEKEIDKTA